MKKLLGTLVLMSVFSITTLAGQIPTGGIAPPPPPGDSQTSSGDLPSDLTGEIPTGGFASQAEDAFLSGLLAVLNLVN